MILHQSFATNGKAPGRRFYEIGRRLAEQGHQVTVITGNSRLGLSLGKKRIGLLQQDGMAIVAFNTGDGSLMKPGEKQRICSVFARQAARQGRRLPPPDLVLASSPPPALAGSALSLSTYYRAPLIMEIREPGDSVTGAGENWLKKMLSFPVRRRELKAYCAADSVIFTSRETAARAAESFIPVKMVSVLPEDEDFGKLFQEFSKTLASLGGSNWNL